MRILTAENWSSTSKTRCTSTSHLSREPSVSTSRGNLLQGSLDHLRSRQGVEKLLTSWSCLRNIRVCTTSSTCYNSGSVCKRQTVQIFIKTLTIRPTTFSQISLIVRGRSASWMKQSVAPEVAPSSISRFSEATTPKQKQHGSVKTISDLNFRTFLAPSLGISGTRFL